MHRRSDRLFPIHPHNLNKVIQDEWNSIMQWLCDVLSSGDIMCEINPVFTTIQRLVMSILLHLIIILSIWFLIHSVYLETFRGRVCILIVNNLISFACT